MFDPTTISLRALGEALLGATCSLLFVYFCSFSLGGIVFGPIQAAMKYPVAGTRYNIADIVILLIQMQVVAALIFAGSSLDHSMPATRLTIGIFVVLSLGAWWFAGVRMLTRAQITSTPMRYWFLGFLVPVGYVMAATAMWLPFALIASITILFLACTWGNWELLPSLVPIVSLATAHIAGILVCRLACRAIVRNGRAEGHSMSPSSVPFR